MRRYPSFTDAPSSVETLQTEGTVAATVLRRRFLNISDVRADVETLDSLGVPSSASGTFQPAWVRGANVLLQPGVIR